MLSLNSLKIYIVSLHDEKKRRISISKQLDKLGLEYEFFDAINPKANEEYLKYYDEREAKKNNGRGLSLGEIGCALSHQFIYEKILNNDYKYTLILEDDALLGDKLLSFLASVDDIDLKWDVILLGYSKVSKTDLIKLSRFNPIGGKTFQFGTFKIGKVLKNSTCGTVAYLINKNGAKKIYRNNANLLADNWPYFDERLGLRIYHCRPFLVFEDYLHFDSSIESERLLISNKNMSFFLKDFLKYFRGFYRYLVLSFFKR